jgi:hypothetical protein
MRQAEGEECTEVHQRRDQRDLATKNSTLMALTTRIAAIAT